MQVGFERCDSHCHLSVQTHKCVTLGKKYIHALFHSQHIASSAVAWRNVSHALGTSSRAFLVLSSVSLIHSFLFLALGESCTQCYCALLLIYFISPHSSFQQSSQSVLSHSLTQKQDKSRDRWKRQLQNVFISFWEPCTKDRQRVLIQTHEEQHLIKSSWVSHGGSLQELGPDKVPMVCGVQEWAGHGSAAVQSLWRLCKQWHLLCSSLWLRKGVPF